MENDMSNALLSNNPMIQELMNCIQQTDTVVGSNPKVDYVIISNMNSKFLFTFTKNDQGYQLTWREGGNEV